MAKTKVYAVRKGKVTGIFMSWNDCKDAVSGYSGAEYKSFLTLNEAESYLNVEPTRTKTKPIENNIATISNENLVVTYVDGSYDDISKRYSYGIVIILPSGEEIEYYGYQDDVRAVGSRNVAGELLGAMVAVKKIVELGYDNILIKHDYEGIAKWCTKEWKAKSFVAIQYVEFMFKYDDSTVINFEWVKGHSGNKYNDIVDNLARLALKKEKEPNTGNNSLVVENLKQEEIEAIMELLRDEYEVEVKCTPQQGIIKWTLFLEKERLVSSYYTSSRKFVVQGKPGIVFSVLSSCVLELVDNDQLYEAFNPFFNIDIDKNTVENEFQVYLPNKNIPFSSKLDNTLKQAIYNLQLQGEMYDYSYLSFPALRGLEGFLKLILSKHNIECGKSFHCFVEKTNNSGTYMLMEKYNSNIGSPNKIRYVNRAYDYYRKHRHTLFHWDEIGETDTTRILQKNNWREMVSDTLKLIDDYFVVR